MSGIAVILALDLFVAGLLSAVFLMIAVYDRSRVAARWLALSYAIGMGGVVLLQAVMTQVRDARPALVASAICMAVGLAGLNVGLARHYHVKVPWRLLGVLLAGTILAEFA